MVIIPLFAVAPPGSDLDPCDSPGARLTQPSGTVASQGYNDMGTGRYENNIDCRWEIAVDQGQVSREYILYICQTLWISWI